MLSEIHVGRSSETHEQFVQRASKVFPEQQAKAGSRFERAVFNHLLAPLIHKRGYSAITDEILQKVRECMDKIVLQCEAGFLEV